MTRLFANLRKALLNEGRTAAYLKYAIGEIVLVVAGILIALQVNDWNDARHERAREREALERLHDEAVKDVRYFDNEVAESRERVDAQEVALAALSRGDWTRADAAAMSDGLASLNQYPTQSPPRSTYDDLVSSGAFGGLSDIGVRTAVAAYYSQLQYAQGQLEYARSLTLQFREALLESGGMRATYSPATQRRISVEYDFPELAGDRRFMNNALMGMSNQRLMQANRLDTLARARAMCAALSEAVGKPCDSPVPRASD